MWACQIASLNIQTYIHIMHHAWWESIYKLNLLKVGYLETHTYTSWSSFCHRLHCYGVFGVWDGSWLALIAHHLRCYGMFAGSHHQHHERRRHEPKRPFPPRPPFITKRWWKGSFFAFHNCLVYHPFWAVSRFGFSSEVGLQLQSLTKG